MARGFGAVASAAEDIQRRKNSGGNFTLKRYFKIDDGEEAIVRFLEEGEDVVSGWFHPVQFPERRFPTMVPCRDQDPETGERIGEDCPGCEKQLKRKFQVVLNVIWRNAPVFDVDEDGKVDWSEVVGYEDQVAIWRTGTETADALQIAEIDYKGLKSRDFRIRRRGKKLDTKYTVTPADIDGGAQPMSKADKKLEEAKYDLNELVAPESYEKWGKPYKKESEEVEVRETSAFLRRNRS